MPRYFINPYNFVRIQPPKGRKEPRGHDRFNLRLFSGRLTCTFRTITPVASKSKSLESERVIYGTSLKGVFRSVAEAIAQSCFTFGGPKCTDENRLCICCRMLGWLQEGKVHAGRVNISDAKLTSTSDWRKNVYIREFALNTPRSNHRRFYYDVRDEKRGRKFYYHHTPTPAKGVFDRHEINTKPVAVARAGLTFGFKVDFSDLEAPELGLLVYALQLEDGWFHKLLSIALIA